MKIRKIGPNADLQDTNNKKKKYIIIVFSTIILSTAAFFGYKYLKPEPEIVCFESDTQIYDHYKYAVVLIKHNYGYFAKINGTEIPLSLEEVKDETIYGTGFFIDKNGIILTNAHVLQPWNSSYEGTENVDSKIRNIRVKIASILTKDVSEEDYESFIQQNWKNASAQEEGDGEGGEEGDEGNEESNAEDSGEEFVNSNETEVDSLNIATSIPVKEYVSVDDIEVYVKTIEVSVALHNSNDQWLSCVVKKISENTDIDLGIIQLTDHLTPESVPNVIRIEDMVEEDGSLSPGEKAIMIGYPLGMDLAKTNSGIKVQLYDGKISKESDGTKIQYSITSTHGASGAPVFNECGQLIAVNFSGVDQVQGFNFGIVAKHIRNL